MVFPVGRKKETSQETIMEESKEEDSPQNVPQKSGEQTDPFEDWPELQRLLEDGEPVEALFEKGWKPILKSKPNGKQYINLRLHGRNQGTGDVIDTERGLGVLDPENHERWDSLLALYEESKPPLPSVPSVTKGTDNQPNPTAYSHSNRSSVLTTKVGRIAPIGPSVQIKLGTLQWYTWVQQAAGYPGSLDDFINDTVDSYFREHHHLELAVVIQGEEN